MHALGVIRHAVHEHFCDLSPDEEPSVHDGHFLVVVLDGGQLSDAFAEYCERRVLRLSDKAEFQIAMVAAADFPRLSNRAPEFPALYHFSFGKERKRAYGLDDCLDFLREFILNNKRQ